MGMIVVKRPQFVDNNIMDADDIDEAGDGAAAIAAAIGEPARSRMLFCLMDGHARTSTELSVVADVSPSTASAHLNRLKAARLVAVLVQGKHRYYSLASGEVAKVLEGLGVLAGGGGPKFAPTTPNRLRSARTCYDHIAGEVGVALHDRFTTLKLLTASGDANDYDLTPEGGQALSAFGVDVAAARAQRRRFAYGCLDWSERRPHLAGALGAAVLRTALSKGLVTQDLDSRALSLTDRGRREFSTRFGVKI